MAKHARYGASSAYRWMKCPASIKASEGADRAENRFMREGTRAHALAEHCLREGQDAVEWLGRIFKLEDGDEFEVTPDAANAVQIYLDDVREVVNRPGKDAVEWRVEERVEFDDECFGTVDCSAYDPREAWLYVWDYKHGAGVRVAAPGNAQLLFYATAAATKLNRPLSGITATIVQPRHLEAASAGVISRVEYDVIDLLEHASAIKTAVAAAKAPDAPLVTGDHCHWCPAFNTCPAAFKHSLAVAGMDFQHIGELPDETTEYPMAPPIDYSDPARAGKMLRLVKFMKKWAETVEKEIKENARKTLTPPAGYKWVAGPSKRSWHDEEQARAEAVALYGEEILVMPEPSKLQAALGKRLFDKDFRAHVNAMKGQPMLMDEKSTRKAIEPDFENIELENPKGENDDS